VTLGGTQTNLVGFSSKSLHSGINDGIQMAGRDTNTCPSRCIVRKTSLVNERRGKGLAMDSKAPPYSLWARFIRHASWRRATNVNPCSADGDVIRGAVHVGGDNWVRYTHNDPKRLLEEAFPRGVIVWMRWLKPGRIDVLHRRQLAPPSSTRA
jgi:hypothetical protein